MQVGGLRSTSTDRGRDQTKRLVEVRHKTIGDDVVAQRRLGVGDALGEFEDEVAGARTLRDVDELAQESLMCRWHARHGNAPVHSVCRAQLHPTSAMSICSPPPRL